MHASALRQVGSEAHDLSIMGEPSPRHVGRVRFALGALLRLIGAALMVATGLAVLGGLGVLTYIAVSAAIDASLDAALGYLFLLFIAGRLGAPIAFAIGGGIAGLFLTLGSELLDHDTDGPLGFGGLFDDGGPLDLGGLGGDLGGGSWDGGDGGGGDGGA